MYNIQQVLKYSIMHKRKDIILGSRRFSNYWWATIIFIGGLSFITVGISSYINLNLLPFASSSNIAFIPQGAIMTFYGVLATCLGSFLWLTILWNIGAGYNEYNHKMGTIVIFRLGFPGKNRLLKLTYRIQDIQAITLDIQEGISPKREIYLKTKDERFIPLTRVGQPMLLSDIENQATELAKFLGVFLEGTRK
jgi:hypothetical protein